MATVAIIHAADDALPARALAEKLRQARLTVVLEQQPGEELRNAVKSAQVTIALWSPRSNAQPQLADEVAFARGKSKVIHATMQNASPPDGFRGDKTVNLTGWRGEDDFPAWRELAKLVADKAGVAPLPPPAPRPPSGFFQPGAYNPNAAASADARGPAPRPTQQRPQQAQSTRSASPPRPAPQRENLQPREPSSGGNRGLIIGAIVFVVVALLGAGGYYFWQQGQNAQTATSAWDSVDHNSADALRSFLSNDPGDHRADAERALAELEERSFEAASDSDTIEAFEGFLNDFPESQHALAARGRIAELRTLQPSATDTASTSATGTTTDPDLLPPTATTAPAPATPSPGPATISPPPTEQTPTEQPPLPSTTP